MNVFSGIFVSLLIKIRVLVITSPSQMFSYFKFQQRDVGRAGKWKEEYL